MKTAIFSILGIILLISCGNQSPKETTDKTPKSANEPVKTENTQQEITERTKSLFSFNDDKVGDIPSNWTADFTGKGKLGKWKIIDDDGNNVMAQTSKENFGSHFDVVLNNELSFKDVEISVKFKGVDGEEDQGGGPVWRYQDADNYYIARANPLEDNYRVYKVINGNRKMLKSINIEVTTGEWHLLKITMKDDKIECFYDGELYLSTTDNTFKNTGKVGLWTKADAVTYFDDFEVNGK